MVGFLLFCVVGFFTVAFGQQAPNQVIFKTICEDGTVGCNWKENCSSRIFAQRERIRLIEESTLAGCVGIGRLDLYDNKISEISKNAFQGQQYLQVLILYGNQIKALEPGVFDPLTSLWHLELYNNLIEVIKDSLFAKNVNLERFWLHENKIFAIGPNAFQQLSNLRVLTLYGNPCMHPDVTERNTNPQKLGVFFTKESGYRQWNNENNECVSAYIAKYSFKECNIEKENLRQKLTDLSGTSENCKSELAKNQNAVKTCNLENQKISEGHKKSLLDAQIKFETENDQVMAEIAENEREKNIIILVLSIVIFLLLIIIIVESVMIWKLKTKNADQKDQIIRLDRLAPKHIYEPVDQEPEPQYEEIQ
jgi:hypothetical protein